MRIAIEWIGDGNGWYIPWLTVGGVPVDPPPPAIPADKVIEMGYDLDQVRSQAERNAEDPRWALPDSET